MENKYYNVLDFFETPIAVKVTKKKAYDILNNNSNAYFIEKWDKLNNYPFFHMDEIN